MSEVIQIRTKQFGNIIHNNVHQNMNNIIEENI